MNNTDAIKLQKFKRIFFTIKILEILFCASPTFQFFFQDTTENTFANINIPGILLSLGIICAITFMWVIMDYNGKYHSLITVIEIAIFYAICVVSIMLSGGVQSYYKFMFIFMVVSYTIELGSAAGFIISGVSTLFLLSLDVFQANTAGVNQYFQSDIALCAMFAVVAWILGVYVRLENEHIESLKNYANLDGLTQIMNHRCFYEHFESICEAAPVKNGAAKENSKESDTARQANANQESVSLLIIDIDNFKVYNDVFGHLKGDVLLTEMANFIKHNLPSGGEVYRYGGDELAIIVHGEKKIDIAGYAEKLRNTVAQRVFDGEEMLPSGGLTVSIGVAELKRDGRDGYMDVIARADSALYKAKFFRKNKVEVYSSLFDEFSKLSPQSEESIQSVKSFLTIINSRDCYTYNHTDRVVRYCEIFADYLGLDIDSKKTLIYSAYLHDLGKINVSKNTLITESRLSDDEWDEIRRHPSDGAEIILQMKSIDPLIAEIVRQHHERYDGKGYPNGISGEQIQPLARMLTLADSFDAMTAKRPYQNQKSYDEAFFELRRCEGTQFDPELTEKFIEAVNQAI